MPSSTSSVRPSRRARALALALGVTLGLLAGELAFRAVLFSDLGPLPRLGRALRDPKFFGHPLRDDLYWTLSHRWSGRSPDVSPGAHPRYGWRSARFDGLTLAHRLEPALGDRTPILLFGDSFTHCLTPPDECFQGVVAKLPLRSQAVVLNHGVGGYGMDQIHLVASDSLERWAGLLEADPDRPRPVVVVAIYIEDDVDRAALGFRSHVKPRYVLEGDALRLVLPESLSTREVVALRGFGVRSWLARYALHSTSLGHGVRERRAAEHQRDLRALTEHLAADLVARCRALELELCFLLLPGKPALNTGSWRWQEPMLEEVLPAVGARFVNARHDFVRDGSAHDRRPPDYFGANERPLWGHYNSLGNQVATAALLRALAGDDDGGSPRPDAALSEAARGSFEELRARLAGASEGTETGGPPARR